MVEDEMTNDAAMVSRWNGLSEPFSETILARDLRWFLRRLIHPSRL